MVAVGLGQEQTGKKLLNELEKTEPGNDDFRTLLLQVTSALRQHVSFEEGQTWPRLQLVLDPDHAEALGSQVAAARPSAPTRPHPLMPPDPRLLETVGPLVAAMDRARDTLRRRG